jgi:hypothetical protein
MRRTFAPLLIVFMLMSLSITPGRAASVPEGDSGAGSPAESDLALLNTALNPTTISDKEMKAVYRDDGTIDISHVLRKKNLPLDLSDTTNATLAAARPLAATQAESITYTVGMTRTFVGLNSVTSSLFRAVYDVRYKSEKVEIWVQSDLRYRNPDGSINPVHPDARDPEYINQQRVDTLAKAFEDTIQPNDVRFYGAYADRDGSEASPPSALGVPDGYYAGPPQSVIILVSNVRDDNFFDPVNNPSFIAGFFTGQFNFFADRNIITIDSKQWDRRVGAPSFDYDATIAHELQHLIHADQDPGEETWLNEAASELSEMLNGYRPDLEAHRTQFSDYPENSLVLWGDQEEDPEQLGFGILTDYQQSYWFYLYLAGRLKQAGIGLDNQRYLSLVTELTKDQENGIASVNKMLAAQNAPFDFLELWNDWRVELLRGGTSDATQWGDYISKYQSPPGTAPIAPIDLGRLRRNLDFEGYDAPGAPPYGTDYIEIGWSPGIQANTPLTFNGDTSIPTDWSVIKATDALTPSGAVSGNVLFSGHTDLTDNFLVFGPVTVPNSGNRNLVFDTAYNIEEGYDLGVVQVTEDVAGATGFTSLQLTGMITDAAALAEDALPLIRDNLPGFNGVSDSAEAPDWVRVTYDMSAYSGKQVLLAFRYMTDSGAAGTVETFAPGWYIDNLSLGGSSLYGNQTAVPANAKSIWQARNKLNQFQLDFAVFGDNNGDDVTKVVSATVDANGDGAFNLGNLLSEPGFNGPGERTVGMVSVIPPAVEADLISSPSFYADYTLTGLPSTLYTSRVRAIGTASDTSIRAPRVFPGDTFTVEVIVDNLGRNEDLEAAPGPAFVAVPVPANTTYVDGSFGSDVSPGNFQAVENLQTIDGSFPAGPGLLWNGTVNNTANMSFTLDVADSLAVGTIITPTVHIANAAFNANPSQRFTDIETPVQVRSPFALSSGVGPASVKVGSTAIYTYTLINTDDAAREIDLNYVVATGLEEVLYSVTNKTIGGSANTAITPQNNPLTKRVTVPSYLETGQVTEVVIGLRVTQGFIGDRVDPQVKLLQPGTQTLYNTLAPSRVASIVGRLYLPVARR